MGNRELKILRLLMTVDRQANPRGLTGAQIVEASNGYVARGTVYATLDRMHGLVRATRYQPGSHWYYTIESHGRVLVRDFCREMGFVCREAAEDRVAVVTRAALLKTTKPPEGGS